MVQLCAVPNSIVEYSEWISRMAKPMYDTLKALCLDRHRERTFTESILLPAFGSLQNEAAAVDEVFRETNGLDSSSTPAYATNYTIVQTLRLMERHVGLGIELGLYPHWYDLSQAFWYRDFLLSALINVQSALEKERIERKLLEYQIKLEHEEDERKSAHNELACSQKKGGGGKKKKGKKQKASAVASSASSRASAIEEISKVTPESLEDRIDFTICSLRRSLCRGMVRLIACLHQANLLKDPPATIPLFTSHKRRFDKRFEVFRTLPQPPGLSYDDFEQGSDFSAVKNRDLIASANDCFRTGKKTVDRLLEVILPTEAVTPNPTEQRMDGDFYVSIRREEIRALLKVCVSNSLFLLKLEPAINGQDDQQRVSLVFDAHKEYCTIASI